MAAVIGMGGRAPGNLAQEIAGHNRVGICPAYAARGIFRNPAGAHVTDPAAKALGTKPAWISLAIQPGKAGVYAFPLCLY
jgi:hypothetical protein